MYVHACVQSQAETKWQQARGVAVRARRRGRRSDGVIAYALRLTVRRLDRVEGARRDEEHVVGVHVAVLSRDRAA